MKLKNPIICILLILAIIFSCNSKPSKEEIEYNAIKVAETLNSNNIDIFREWNFFQSKFGENWSKMTNPNSKYYDLYVCYKKNKDTTKIRLHKKELFSPDFNLKLKINTQECGEYFLFSKYKKNKIKIEHSNNFIFKKKTLGDNFNLKYVFYNKDPFTKLDSLSKLKNELKIYDIRYYPHIGNMIRFYLSYNDVLYYIPEKAKLNKHWIDKLSRSKKIQEKWYLFFDDTKLDNG